jgi:vacuolar iron transporter family protein
VCLSILNLLALAFAISIASSFVVGAIKDCIPQMNLIKGGVEMAGLGTGIALVGYGIGAELARVGIVNVQ